MSKLDEKIALYIRECEKLGISCNVELLKKVTIGLGPSIYSRDSETVSGSDEKEKETVKKNFLIKKLSMTDSPLLDAGIDKVLHQMGKSNRNKYRAIVYYLLVKHFNKEGVY